jgi:hypothetical protein
VDRRERWREPRLLVWGAVGLLVFAAALVLVLTRGGSESGEKLIDGEELASCLDAADSLSAVHVQAGSRHEFPSDDLPSTADIDVRGYGDLTAYPSVSAAEELRSRVTFEGELSAEPPPDAARIANVLKTNYGERKTDSAQEEAVKGCLKKSATVSSSADEGGFADCGAAPRLERLSVRGASCEQARAFLTGNDFAGLKECDDPSSRFACLNQYLCCMLFADYMGDGHVEYVFNR